MQLATSDLWCSVFIKCLYLSRDVHKLHVQVLNLIKIFFMADNDRIHCWFGFKRLYPVYPAKVSFLFYLTSKVFRYCTKWETMLLQTIQCVNQISDWITNRIRSFLQSHLNSSSKLTSSKEWFIHQSLFASSDWDSPVLLNSRWESTGNSVICTLKMCKTQHLQYW